ncbi:MAG TPA: cupin domain-containing protein [Mycobacteriales bacterium]|nr:cupin domain-containing protein [Mycobacteriales bacterium]
MTVRLSGQQPETFDAAGVTFVVLDDGAATNGRIGLVECRLAAGWGGPPQHIHREHDETFYVLSGSVRFTSGSESFLAEPGQLVTAPIGDPHTFANNSAEEPAGLLCTVAPERYINYFRELSQLAATSSGPPDPAAILQIMSRYATEPYRPA